MGMLEPNLGKRMTGLSSALFSNVQQRVLALIFGDPSRSYYTSEIVKAVRSGAGAVQRELARLEESGLVSVSRIGNQKHFQANRQSPIFEELRGIVIKTVGLVDPLRDALAPFSEKMDVAFVYGSVAKGADTARSDIDLMVIGKNLSYSDLYDGLQKAEKILGRPVNPNIMSPDEWRRKRATKGSFADRIGRQPKIFIFGTEANLNL